MAAYIIRGEQVKALAATPAKAPKGSLMIRSADEIATSDVPPSRLVALWNALPGVAPVTKFKDRKTAARRLWAAFQQISPVQKKTSTRPEKPRAITKQAQVIALLRRPRGATIDAIVAATGWQRHTIRGVIAGVLKKQLGLDVVSEKTEQGRSIASATPRRSVLPDAPRCAGRRAHRGIEGSDAAQPRQPGDAMGGALRCGATAPHLPRAHDPGRRL